MPAIAIVVSIVLALAVWWWRIQRVRDAASTLVDVAGRAKGAYSRHRFKTKAASSVLAGVKDPASAAAVLLYSLAYLKGLVSTALETRIAEHLRTTCRVSAKDLPETIAFANWAAGQIPDTNEIIRRLSPLWRDTLEEAQREELIAMARDVADYGSPAADAQLNSIRKLRDALLEG